MDLLIALLLCALGYLSGSVLYAPLVCRLLNAPPRTCTGPVTPAPPTSTVLPAPDRQC